MTFPFNDFSGIQADLVNILLSEAWAQYVSIFAIVDKRIDSEVKKAALGGRNGKCGSTIEVLCPQLIEPEASSGRILTLKLAFMIKDWDTLAQGASGSKLKGEQIAGYLLQTFWQFSCGGICQALYPDPDCFTPVMQEDNAYRMFAVRFRATFDLTQANRTSQPGFTDGALSGGNRTITLVDNQPGGGSTLYYTTDGSTPGPSTLPGSTPPGTSIVYSAPISVAVGALLRFRAFGPAVAGVTPFGSSIHDVNVS